MPRARLAKRFLSSRSKRFEINNRIVQLTEDEAAEITRILAELSERLRDNLVPLRFAAETIAEFDWYSHGRALRVNSNARCPNFPLTPPWN